MNIFKNAIFMNIFSMNISASFIIIIALVLRKFTINKLSHNIFFVFWILVIIKFFIPFSFYSKFSIYNTLNRIKLEILIFNKPILELRNTILNIINRDIQIGFNFSIKIIYIIWIVGSIFISLYFFKIFFKSKSDIKKCVPLNSNITVNKFIQKSKIPVKVSDTISTPVSCGIIKKIIILPKNFNFNDKKLLKYVLIHEYIHIKYNHYLLKIISIILLCIYWFNPFVWILFNFLDRDLEISCDRKVIELLGESQKEPYALSLISMAECNMRISSLYNNFNKNCIEERIVAIMKFKKASIFTVSVSLMVLLAVSTVFATTDNYLPLDEYKNLKIVGVSEECIDPSDFIEDKIIEIYDDNIDKYITDGMVRVADAIYISNYEYSSYSNLPSKLTITTKRNGYTYKGTLNLVKSENNYQTGKNTGYYSGVVNLQD